ncbi:alpha-kinase family domain-containing protein [Ditylenchus destructor]|uniref:Alpha-kinase family domain-containing protein n=1 Tax=Ditylenchus destructor TaxID=166010 RepID=A0AAD4MP72_9BILA|nr:alpha-kinase family domain-containing protein [Ditylenchus destructor]
MSVRSSGCHTACSTVEIFDPKQMAPQEADLFKRPSFEQPFNSKVNRKRRGVSVTFAEGTKGANGPANSPASPPASRPATPPPANPPKRFAAGSGEASWLNLVPETNLSSWTHERVVTNKEVRERNKNFRRIFEEEGMDYGNDVSAAELRNRMSSAVNLRSASVAKMFKILNASRDVQLCFLVDVTGSMTGHIKGVRDSIFKIVEKLTEKHVTSAGHSVIAKKISMSFVGYRDFGYEDQFEILPFTDIAENFRQFCSAIRTSTKYGAINDAPEDVFGGLEKAISDLSWSDTMCTKIIFHIADHPCHGTKYHTSDYPYSHKGSGIKNDCDRYPDGDPNGRTAENLFNALREKGVQYHFGKITAFTDKMIELFSEAIGNEIEVFDIKQIDTLVDNVVSSVSIGTSMHPAMRAKQHVFKIERAVSHGFLMVVDLQGIISTDENDRKTLELTDPAIHCIDLTRYGKTNYGFEGMKTFFGRHVCNKFCTAMELKHPGL